MCCQMERVERQKSSSTGTLTKWLQQMAFCQAEAESQELHLGLHLGGRNLSTGVELTVHMKVLAFQETP